MERARHFGHFRAPTRRVDVDFSVGPAITLRDLIMAGSGFGAASLDAGFSLSMSRKRCAQNRGRSLAIPMRAGDELPAIPPRGIPPQAEPGIVPAARTVDQAELTPGKDPITTPG